MNRANFHKHAFQFSQKVDYGLFLLVALAKLQKTASPHPFSLKKIAEKEHMSFFFLQKIARDLVKAGMISSERGNEGGYRIAKNPRDISLKHIIEALEGPVAVMSCLTHLAHGEKLKILCARSQKCRIRSRLSEINTDIETLLKSVNLEYFLTEQSAELPKKIVKPNILKIENLHVRFSGKEILRGVNLTIRSGEIHALMGPNGSGKSTLCSVIMGHPAYRIRKGSIFLNGKNIKNMPTNERANRGIFLGFQSPTEISGVRMENFLRLAKNTLLKDANKKARTFGPREFHEFFEKNLRYLNMPQTFSDRNLNEGFSGGEKKRAEILQMAVLQPKIVLLDEIDSGLDIDGLRIVAENMKKFQKETGAGMLIITHYQRILEYIEPNFVHVMKEGRIIRSGGRELAWELERKGYGLKPLSFLTARTKRSAVRRNKTIRAMPAGRQEANTLSQNDRS